MAFHRSQFMLLKKRTEEEQKKFIQVLYGPRQVGKTTLVQQVLKQLKIPSPINLFEYRITNTEWMSKDYFVI